MKSSKSRLQLAVAALVCLSALALTACGGSDSDSSGGTTVGTETTNGGGETAGSDIQAEAVKLVEEAEQPPTEVPENEPLEKAPPKGKTLAWLDCGVPTCEAYSKYIKETTDALGWNFKEFHGGASPETITNAMKEVVASKPDAFMAIATPISILQPFFDEFKAAEVPVVMCCELAEPVEPLAKMVGGEEHGEQSGRFAADWIIADGGEEANAAFLTTKDFKILGTYVKGFDDELKRLNPNIETGTIDVASTNIGKPAVATSVVSYLRAHPDVKYVGVAFDDLATGIPAALQAAGLSDVQLVGCSANALSIEGVKKGEENWGATVQFGPEWPVWGISVLIRAMNGEPIGDETLSPEYLITPKNAPDNSNYPPVIPDMLQQYEKLWGI